VKSEVGVQDAWVRDGMTKAEAGTRSPKFKG
jgi:hypothetical protein